MNTTTYGLKSWRYTGAKIWNALPDQFCAANNMSKAPGKRGHIVAHDFSWAAQTGKHFLRTQNVSEQNQKHFLCPGHKICVRNKCCARGQTGKRLCRQQCVRNNVSSFVRALRWISQILHFNCARKYILLSCDPLLV